MTEFDWIYLCGSILAVFIFLRWAWNEDKERDITLSDISFFVFISVILGIFSWVAVFCWIVSKCSKYGDKVIIKRRKNYDKKV